MSHFLLPLYLDTVICLHKATMYETYIDRLPIELIYQIFSYFSCDEIFHSFYSITEYLNNVMKNYDWYFMDLSSSNIRKKEFDLICSIVNPSQIIRLKLGQTRLNLFEEYFIHRNNETPLNRLRSLWLDETISFNQIFSKWFNSNVNLDNLSSFRFDLCNDPLLNNQFSYSFKNLSHLVGCSSSMFRKLSNQIPNNLTFLHMFFDTLIDVYYLVVPNSKRLKSLGIGIKSPANEMQQFYFILKDRQWTQLIQFNLNLPGLL